MKIDELISELEQVKEEHGNLEMDGWDVVIEENKVPISKHDPSGPKRTIKTITFEYEPVFIPVD